MRCAPIRLRWFLRGEVTDEASEPCARGGELDAEPSGVGRFVSVGDRNILHGGAVIADLPVRLFPKTREEASNRLVLDFDAADDPVHGFGEGRFFHGYYDRRLPSYIC